MIRRARGVAATRRTRWSRAGRFEVLEQRALLSTFTVNTTADENSASSIPGQLSLREAIILANASPGPNTIIVPAGDYLLTIAGSGETAGQTGDLNINSDLSIQGAGSATTIIDGNGLDRVFDILGSGANVPVVSISGVTIQNGRAPDSPTYGLNNGGGIEVSDASLTVNRCVIQDNTTGNGGYAGNGGGIDVQNGTLSITNSTITGNTTGTGTTLGGSGGGVSGENSSVTIQQCLISNNTTGTGATSGGNVSAGRGGGVYDDGSLSTIDITGSTITGNVSGGSASLGEGGGIYNYGGSTLFLDNSTVSSNTASLNGGGVMNDNGTTDHITNCTIANNTAQGDGGGFYGGGGIVNTSGTIKLISGTTISGNTATSAAGPGYGGGGIYTDTHIGMIINSTIEGNTTNADGGGIVNNGNIDQILNTTIADNSALSGGGLYHTKFANVTTVIGQMTNTIIAGNGGNDLVASSGAITSATYDLVQDPTGNTLVNGINNNIVGLDPKLGPLTNNGGPTETMALLPGSPAINAGSTANAPGTDQRGLPRPAAGGTDIGAYQVQSLVDHPPVASSQSLSTNEDAILSGQVSATDVDGDHLSYLVVTGPLHGTVALHSDGSFWYTPPAFYSGTDSFTFEAFDGQDYSNIATVSINVVPVSLPQVASIPFTTMADGTVSDRNLDGVYDSVNTTGTSITDRWFTDPTIGQERGIFEFNLSRIAPGTPIQSVTIGLQVTSFTSTSVGGVVTDPQLVFQAYAGTGSVTTADGSAAAVTVGTATVSSLGYQLFSLSPSLLEPFEGGFASVRLENSSLNGNWISVASVEDTSRQSSTLTLQISSVPTFALSIAPATIKETAGANAATATLTRTGDLSLPLTVNLTSNNTSQLTVPATVTFAAGQSSLSFGATAVNGVAGSSSNVVTVSAAASVVSDPVGLDPSFGVGGLAPTSLTFHDQFPYAAIARQPDGKILAASQYSANAWQLTRLNPDGTLDTSFGVNGVALATFPVTAATGNYPDPYTIVVQPDGNILVGGKIVEGYGTPALCRFTSSGQLDPTFGTGGIADLSTYETPSSAWVDGIALRPDGRILLAIENNGTAFLRAVQLLPSGVPDSTFGSGGETPQLVSDATVALDLLSDGEFVLVGLSKVAMFNASGTALDTTFGSGGIRTVNFGSSSASINASAIDSAGRILLAGTAPDPITGATDMAVARLTAQGSMDTTFGNGGSALVNVGGFNNQVTTLVVQPDNKIVLAGLAVTASNQWTAAIVRLSSSGALDSTFNGSGTLQQSIISSEPDLIYSVVLQPNDGKLVALSGWANDFRVARFTMGNQSAAVSASAQISVKDFLPPVANNDSYAADENTALSVAKPGVLGNDTDPNNASLMAVVGASPAHGTLTLNADGSFTYTPAANFVGTDSFTYKASDGLETSGTATVTITVAPPGEVTFLKQDTTTQGTWVGAYGTQGYDIVSGSSKLPSNDTITPSGQATYTWTTTSSDPRALQVPGSSNRVAAVWYSSTKFTVNVNLADGQAHDLELYFDDWDNKGRGEQVQISDAGTGKLLDTETLSSFVSGVYLDWKVSGNLVITITRQAGANAVLNGLFLDSTSSPPPTATASFLKQDTTTQGSWTNTYGTQGYDIVSGPSKLPANDTVTPSGQSTYTWTTTSSDPRGLQVPGSSNRVAAVWYSATKFTVAMNLADGQTHNLELYFDDWDSKGRGEQVQISDASTGTVLDTETISSFTNGVYLDWKVSGNLVITITRQAGANAVLNGVFLDSTSSPPPIATASFLKQDTTTQGSWINTYGSQGYDIVSGPVKLPSNDTVTPSGQTTYTATTTSSDPRALQVPGSSNRVAAVWYSATKFTVDVNLADGQTHNLELYFLDWTNIGRAEQVQISDAGTGTVLDTETISSFASGVYLDWKVSGNVVITITRRAGANAVLNGVFFDPPTSSMASVAAFIPNQSGGRSTPQTRDTGKIELGS